MKANHKNFSVKDVLEYVEQTGYLQARLQFFEAFHYTSEFYQKIAKPLLSMRTVGSIDVERRIKPVKENILTKKRNCLLDPKGVALYRASENLMASKKRLGKKITDSL